LATTAFKHRNLPRLLLQAREAVMAHTRPSLRGHGLSDQQWRVLRVLGEHGTVETGRVAREAFILGPSLTGVLARMERDGLVRRARDPVDQRRSVVEATAKGLKLVERLSNTVEAHYAWMEQQLGKAKLVELYRLLDEVIALEGCAPEHSRRHTKPCESTISSTASRPRATITSRA
jgi:homoprotocatechuate degradation regulator HpaR